MTVYMCIREHKKSLMMLAKKEYKELTTRGHIDSTFPSDSHIFDHIKKSTAKYDDHVIYAWWIRVHVISTVHT